MRRRAATLSGFDYPLQLGLQRRPRHACPPRGLQGLLSGPFGNELRRAREDHEAAALGRLVGILILGRMCWRMCWRIR